MNFKLLNGTTKQLYLIKDGVEKRSIFLSIKIHLFCRPMPTRYSNKRENYFLGNDFEDYYL